MGGVFVLKMAQKTAGYVPLMYLLGGVASVLRAIGNRFAPGNHRLSRG